MEIRPDARLTACLARDLCARVTVETKDDRVLANEHPGGGDGIDKPMSRDCVVEELHRLGEAFADEDPRNRLIQSLRVVDSRPISDLTELLGQVRPSATYARTPRGIELWLRTTPFHSPTARRRSPRRMSNRRH